MNSAILDVSEIRGAFVRRDDLEKLCEYGDVFEQEVRSLRSLTGHRDPQLALFESKTRGFFATSASWADAWVNGGVDPDRIPVVPYGIDPSVFTRGTSEECAAALLALVLRSVLSSSVSTPEWSDRVRGLIPVIIERPPMRGDILPGLHAPDVVAVPSTWTGCAIDAPPPVLPTAPYLWLPPGTSAAPRPPMPAIDTPPPVRPAAPLLVLPPGVDAGLRPPMRAIDAPPPVLPTAPYLWLPPGTSAGQHPQPPAIDAPPPVLPAAPMLVLPPGVDIGPRAPEGAGDALLGVKPSSPMRAIDALPPDLDARPRHPKKRFVASIVARLMVVLVGLSTIVHLVTGAHATAAPHGPPARHDALRASGQTTITEPPSTMVPTIDPTTEPRPQPPSTIPWTTSPPTTLPSTTPPSVNPAPVESPRVANATVGDPAANIAPSPDFLATCSSTAYDDSYGCIADTLTAIDNARQSEGLGAMTLPTNWGSLTPAEQLFVTTNLERTARGLAPLSAMASALDAEATQAALADSDPSPPAGFPWTLWGGNWAGQIGNPLEAVYYWMYDDGLGSSNESCSTSSPTGCWVHRRNMLLDLTCSPCVMGAGWGTTTQGTSLSEILVDTQGSPVTDFTWAQEQAYLP